MLVPASSYINFGTTSGSSGYGFRDNGGTMEFKNSAGSWTAFGGGGITNSAANTELMMSNGTNAISSGVFANASTGSLTLGSASIASGRSITVASSTATAGLTFYTKGAEPYLFGSTDYTSKSSFDIYQRDFTLNRFSSSEGSYLSIDRYRGTIGSLTTIVNGDSLGIIKFGAYDGSGVQDPILIQGISNGTVASGSTPSDLVFKVGTGSGGTLERLRIDSVGNSIFKNRTSAPGAFNADSVYTYSKDTNSSSEFYVRSESGAEVNISGLFEPVTESGTTITLNETHRNKIVLCSNSGVVTVTVGSGKAAGWNCMLVATHATGTISLTTSGTTINGSTSTTTQFETLSLVHYGSENYLSKLG